MKLKVKAVIFDRDGTIIDTEKVNIDSITKAFAQLGFTIEKEDLKEVLGRSSNDYKEYFLKKWDFDYEKFNNLKKSIYYENIDKAKFFDGVVNLIKSLNKRNVPMAVTTSASKDGTILILNKAGIGDMFKVIVSKEDCSKLKPDPEPYLLTAKKLNIDPKFCIAIEDTALGVESAENAGMFCIAIPNEYTKNQDFSNADLVLESGEEVEEYLELIA